MFIIKSNVFQLFDANATFLWENYQKMLDMPNGFVNVTIKYCFHFWDVFKNMFDAQQIIPTAIWTNKEKNIQVYDVDEITNNTKKDFFSVSCLINRKISFDSNKFLHEYILMWFYFSIFIF